MEEGGLEPQLDRGKCRGPWSSVDALQSLHWEMPWSCPGVMTIKGIRLQERILDACGSKRHRPW